MKISTQRLRLHIDSTACPLSWKQPKNSCRKTKDLTEQQHSLVNYVLFFARSPISVCTRTSIAPQSRRRNKFALTIQLRPDANILDTIQRQQDWAYILLHKTVLPLRLPRTDARKVVRGAVQAGRKKKLDSANASGVFIFEVRNVIS